MAIYPNRFDPPYLDVTTYIFYLPNALYKGTKSVGKAFDCFARFALYSADATLALPNCQISFCPLKGNSRLRQAQLRGSDSTLKTFRVNRSSKIFFDLLIDLIAPLLSPPGERQLISSVRVV